jgi:retinol dehydrogenase-13
MNLILGVMGPISNLMGMTDSNEESAQTSLHCLLSDDAPTHSGAYFSQSSILYRDSECKDGGWPLESPNPNARDMDTARELVDLSYDLVELKKK